MPASDAHAHGARPLRRVLLVEDEPDIRDSLKDLLEGSLEGVEVTAAASGAEAMRILEDVSPHLVITDYKMPGMNGLELLRAVRDSAPGTPRILMTAFPDLEVALKAINEAHIQSFFAKPLDAVQVVRNVSQVLDQEQARHQRALAMARALRRASERPRA